MKQKLLAFVILLFGSTNAFADAFCESPFGLGFSNNMVSPQNNYYVGDNLVMAVDETANFFYSFNYGPFVDLAYNVPAGTNAGIIPIPSSGRWQLGAWAVGQGYCWHIVDAYELPSVNSVSVNGSLWNLTDLTFSASVSGGAFPRTYLWDFGDNTTSAATSPTHQYNLAGTYNVTLTISDANGRQDSHTETITLTDNPNLPGRPSLILEEFTGCYGMTASHLLTWSPGSGPQPTSIFYYKFDNQAVEYQVDNYEVLPWLTAGSSHTVEVRGCLTSAESTCGPSRKKTFTAEQCTGGGGGPWAH